MWNKVIDFFFPIICTLCHRRIPHAGLHRVCLSCREEFTPITGLYCQTCSKPLPDGGAHCYACRNETFNFKYIRAAGVFTGKLRDTIHKFKYQDRPFLAYDLAEFMYRQLTDKFVWDKIDYFVPVPLHPSGLWKRGYNQSGLLAKCLSEFTGKPVLDKVLIRTKKTPPQASLPREERLHNLTAAFTVKVSDFVAGKNVLLIDDVCTTGSTIDACAGSLKAAKVKHVWAATVAHGM